MGADEPAAEDVKHVAADDPYLTIGLRMVQYALAEYRYKDWLVALDAWLYLTGPDCEKAISFLGHGTDAVHEWLKDAPDLQAGTLAELIHRYTGGMSTLEAKRFHLQARNEVIKAVHRALRRVK